MFETKFIVNGKQVSKQVAKQHWLDSATYGRSNKRTRDSIWSIAINGDKFGNHNPHGEIEHLEEAGIKLQ